MPPLVPAVAAQDATSAESLSRSGRHLEAARVYEQEAKHLFRDWETRPALLAAREYVLAGRTADAERVLGRISGPVTGDDAVLLARVRAEIALTKGDGNAALAALATIAQPWPAPLASELLLLKAQAEFSAGRTLDGIHAYEERAALLGAAEARLENDRLLLAALRGGGAPAAIPPGATDSDRAWIELAQLTAATDAAAPADPTAVRRAAEWRARHPNHPGAALLPQPQAGTAAVALSAPGGPTAVALLLPLSGRQQAAGVAVRDGFLAAYLERPDVAPRVRVYDTAALGASAAYQKAVEDGAQFVVGPLTREDVAALAAVQQIPVPTLALNGYAGGAAPPAFLFQFALDPEQEAREAARRIAGDGLARGIALFPRNAWGERVAAAFTAELQTAGVELTGSQYYEPATRDFSGALRAALGRYGGAGDRTADNSPVRRDAAAEALGGPQFAFVAATAQTARALRPQLRFQMSYDIPVYATSDAWDPSTRAASDVDGLVFPEMPWILHEGAGAPALWGVLQREWAAAGRGRLRLYAFGHDAVELMAQLRAGRGATPIDGLTGRLSFGDDGRVRRELEWARIEGGRPQPIGAYPELPPGVP